MQVNNHFDYFSDIEATFIRRRGRNLFLSSKDWQLMQTWEQTGIPLHVVNNAIEQCFDKNQNIGSLAYCVPAVEERFKLWQESQVGAYTEQQQSNCSTCHDTGLTLVPVPEDRRTFSFEMEDIPCPECAPNAM